MENTLSVIFKDDDGYWSGKRILGSGLILIGVAFAIHAEFGDCLCIAQRILVSGMLLSSGLALWGITSVAQYFDNKLQIENKGIDENPPII